MQNGYKHLASKYRKVFCFTNDNLFFARRLDEHERTLAVLTLRIEELFPNIVYVINDLG